MAEKRDNSPRWPQFPEQDENGVDLSLLRANLSLTPTERVRRGDAALRSVEQIHRDNPRTKRIFDRLKREYEARGEPA